MARPSKYKPEYVDQAAKLCALGATDIEIADFFAVEIADIAVWAWKRGILLCGLRGLQQNAASPLLFGENGIGGVSLMFANVLKINPAVP